MPTAPNDSDGPDADCPSEADAPFDVAACSPIARSTP
jgi:hypothetical protein